MPSPLNHIIDHCSTGIHTFPRTSNAISLTTLVLLFFFTAVLPVAHGNAGESGGVVDQAGPEKQKPPVKEKKLAELQPKAAELETKLLDMRAALSRVDKATGVEEEFFQIHASQNKLVEQFHILKIHPEKNASHLTELQNELQEIERDIRVVAGGLDSSIETLDKWVEYWASEEKELAQWRTGLGASNSLAPVQKIILQLQATKNAAREEINNHLLPLLELQGKSRKLQVSAHKLHLEVDALFKDRYQDGLYQHEPSLFSHEFISSFDINLWYDTKHGILQAMQPDLQFFLEEKIALIISIIFFCILLRIFTLSKSFIESAPRWSFIFHRSYSVAVFTSLFTFLLITDNIPPFWLSVFRAITLVCVLLVSREIIKDSLLKNSVTKMIMLLLATDLLVMVSMPMPLMRLYILFVSISLLVFFGMSHKHYLRTTTRYPLVLWGVRFVIVLFLFVLLAEIFGQAELAFFVFAASLKSISLCFSIWAAYLIIMGMVELGLHFTPLALIQTNGDQIARMIWPLPFLGALFLFAAKSLVVWRFFPTETAGITFLTELGFTYGEVKLSLGVLIGAGVVLYLAFSLSKLLQSILLQSVLPRQNVDKSIQLSITRLLHYGIMLTGFLLALGTLGFSLTNLTIMGGALGVGIGFGLQEIIKNFACGLILLFERPIKLGDTIQVGEEMAVVKELGLRATVVETFDNAEIVVPNSDLITGQVTNWTLKERRARVKVPIGVAYGTDIEQVLQILQSCAEENPMVLATPKPTTLFLAFGASSLDFELRVFIPEFTDRSLILSELNLTINSEFEAAGIEIPFPQSDLHIRSIDHAAMAQLSKV